MKKIVLCPICRYVSVNLQRDEPICPNCWKSLVRMSHKEYFQEYQCDCGIHCWGGDRDPENAPHETFRPAAKSDTEDTVIIHLTCDCDCHCKLNPTKSC